MSATIPDIIIPFNDYVSVNQLCGIPNGTPIQIQTKASREVYLQESNSKPPSTSTDGVILTDILSGNSVADVTSGSLEIWARSSEANSRISVVIR